jgi:hypothetical protein
VQCISDYTSVQLDKRTEDMHRRVLMAKIDEDTFKGMDHNQVCIPLIPYLYPHADTVQTPKRTVQHYR